MLELLSIVLSGVGLARGAGSDKIQKRMVLTLEEIRDSLKQVATSASRSGAWLSKVPWLTGTESIHDHTIVLVTGCHGMAEVFDRPTAYSLKFAIDQFGEAYRLKPVYAVVMGDYWFYRDGTNHDRRRVLSIGGPKVNNLTSEILTSGEVIRSERSWVIARSNRRYVIYGDDPSDTLAAMKVFAEQELLKYLQWAWELS